MSASTRSFVVVLALFGLASCETVPRDAFRLSETALETRQAQTREFTEVTEVQILSASSALLQDLGYAIDEIEKPLGVISASKRADATNHLKVFGTLAADTAQCIFTLLLACTGERYKSTDAVQDIRLTLVVSPVRAEDRTVSVRVTMQRIVWDRANRLSDQETISDAGVYQEFFAKLSKSVFLEQEAS